jgi:HKD family nuclease
MFFWSLQITIISLIMIFLVHHLLLFFKSTLTIPKIKDLVNIPAKKYENIYNVMNRGSVNSSQYESNNIKNNSEYAKKEANSEINSMKNELKTFMKKQLQSDITNNTTTIEALDSSISNNYSIY